ncbi:MAG: hypothetical protein Q8L38_05265, partial [Pseudohongiella sp.]|nr:hypothetical protein [Pseudohongiella sp.]
PVDKISKLSKLLKTAKVEANPLLDGLVRLLDPGHNLVTVLAAGKLDGKDAATQAANDLMARARALAARETFFHWWTSFPTVFGAGSAGGFDAIIGNPPWDKIRFEEVPWFSERHAGIANEQRASDRKQLISELQKKKAPLWDSYAQATERAEANARVLGNGKLGSGDYPLLGGGDVNLYSLFIERAQALAAPSGLVALLTPSGIAADKGAAEFFRSISSTGRLGALFDFENRKVFFPDVDSRFKFCALVFGGRARTFKQTRCAFYLHQLAELDDLSRVLMLKAEDFVRVNPNTGAAPIFRNQRDANIALVLYGRHPVLVKHGGVSGSIGKRPDLKVWAVNFIAMFHMTGDSSLFLKPDELNAQGFKPSALNRWEKSSEQVLPLYEGKMVQMYDHRAADVVVNTANLKRAAQQETIDAAEKTAPDRYPTPQYFVSKKSIQDQVGFEWTLSFKQVTSPTNVRSMIAAMIPESGVGHSMAVVLPEQWSDESKKSLSLLLANFNSFVFDYLGRQKLQGQNYSLYILEQLPVIAPARFNEPLPAAFAKAMRAAGLMNGHHPQPTVADFVIPQVLALSYTAHDMAPFARDLGYVDAAGEVLPPFVWNEEERRTRLAALDALFFYLYGLNADDAAYILDTFPIVREQDTRAFGRYRTKEDILAVLAVLTG